MLTGGVTAPTKLVYTLTHECVGVLLCMEFCHYGTIQLSMLANRIIRPRVLLFSFLEPHESERRTRSTTVLTPLSSSIGT